MHMNQMQTRNPFEYYKELDRFMVGGNDLWNRMTYAQNTNASGFPPYNTRKVGENKYLVELAVSGFSKEDIDITVEDNKLTIKGSVERSENDAAYLYKGIATRNFTRSFVLDEYLEVVGAEMVNGMLKVSIERIVPPEKQPRKISIGVVPVEKEPQLLME